MSIMKGEAIALACRLGVSVLLVVLVGCERTTIGEIQTEPSGTLPFDKAAVLSIPVKASKPVSYKWSNPDGGQFLGSVEDFSVKFIPPNTAKVRVICKVTVGDVSEDRMKVLDVVTAPTPCGGGQCLPSDGNPTVMTDGALVPGFGMGLEDSAKKRDWKKDAVDKKSQAITYSGDPSLQWGTVFVTVGEPTDQNRPAMDYSRFRKLVVTMKGRKNDVVLIGVKDRGQPNNGAETKQRVVIDSLDFKPYSVDLRKLAEGGSKLRELYVVCELVFARDSAEIYLKDIRFEM